jgi:hypothetical protein
MVIGRSLRHEFFGGQGWVTRRCGESTRIASEQLRNNRVGDWSSTLEWSQWPSIKLVQTTEDCYGGAMKQYSVSSLGTGTGEQTEWVTVRAVAAEAGLSIATVSRVLNGGGNVAPRTRKRVREVVDRPGDCAPEPRRRQQLPGTRPPAFVRCPYLLTDYFGHIVTSIAETLAQHGQAMVLEAVGLDYWNFAVVLGLRGLPGGQTAIWHSFVRPPRIGLRRSRCSARLIGSGRNLSSQVQQIVATDSVRSGLVR